MKHAPIYIGSLLLALAGILGGAEYSRTQHPKPCPGPLCPIPVPTPVPVPFPVPVPKPCPGPAPCPTPPRKPWGPRTVPVGTPLASGPLGPNGEQPACDLPVSLRKKNIGGTDGAGLCVFTSIMHIARFQNEPRLAKFQEQMSHERGGGYPEKVDKMIAKYAPGVNYAQYEGSDLAVLDLAIKTGRMPGVTYNGHDCHYSGSIAHMVNLIYLDDKEAAILDNNFIGDAELVWMSREEFKQRWTGGDSGWAVFLLNPAPPPAPKN